MTTKLDRPNRKIYSFAVATEISDWLESEAKRQDVSISSVIREAIRRMWKEECSQ